MSKDFLSEEMLDSLLLMDSGIPRSIHGAWLLRRLTYCGMLPGLVNGLCVPDLKPRVISR